MLTTSQLLDARILVVDDQPDNVLLLEQMLRGAGYTSITSTMDPYEVCDLHRKNRYELILLDLQMPGMDGFQVMEGLQEIEADDYLPVLVITAQPGHKLRALQAGAKDFVSKPIDIAEVLARVRNMLEVRILHTVIRRQSDEVARLYDQVVTEQKLSERLLLNVLPDVITIRPDDDIRHLVPAFLVNRRADLISLRVALSQLDFDAIKKLGHIIKETGRGYGFDGVTQIGSALERAAHHEDASAVDTRITHLAEYLHRVHVVE